MKNKWYLLYLHVQQVTYSIVTCIVSGFFYSYMDINWQSDICFLKYFTKREWKMGEKSLLEKLERVHAKILIQYHIFWYYSLSLGNKIKILTWQMDPELFVVKPRVAIQSTPVQTCTKTPKLNWSTNANWRKTCLCQSGNIKSSLYHFVSGWIYYLADICGIAVMYNSISCS